jgi:hypothetical protein
LRTISVSDTLQPVYTYQATEPEGLNFRDDFRPQLTPAQMLELGVFGGAYFFDYPKELPEVWLSNAKLSIGNPDPRLNHFGVLASQPLVEWQQKGWIYPEDPHGWFQWYCRYYLGRRIPDEDDRQIKRWRAIRRHIAQIERNCEPGDESCRPRQRQAVLQWAYDSRKF